MWVLETELRYSVWEGSICSYTLGHVVGYLLMVWRYMAVIGIVKAEQGRKRLGGNTGGREDSGKKGGVAN